MRKMYLLHLGGGVFLLGAALLSDSWIPLHLGAVLISADLCYNAKSCRWIPLPLNYYCFLLYGYRLCLIFWGIEWQIFWWMYTLGCLTLGLLFIAIYLGQFF